jgi:hypothetical protein
MDAAVALEKHLLSAGEDIPVDVPQVIPLGISAILGKLLGKPEIRRPVQPRDEPIDHGFRDQVKPRYGSQRRWVQKSL